MISDILLIIVILSIIVMKISTTRSMTNKRQRELAYVVEIDKIQPIQGADKVELAIVGGWHIMVRKGQFQQGDLAVYFEIDSKVPAEEPFLFLAQKDYRIKTQKYFKGTVA